MNHSPSQSALNKAAATLRGIWAALWSGFGLFGAEPDPEVVIADWVSGIFRRLEELLGQYRAGEIAACDGAEAGAPMAEDSQQACIARARDRAVARTLFVTSADAEAVMTRACGAASVAESWDAHVRRFDTWPGLREVTVQNVAWCQFGGQKVDFSEKMAWGAIEKLCSNCSG